MHSLWYRICSQLQRRMSDIMSQWLWTWQFDLNKMCKKTSSCIHIVHLISRGHEDICDACLFDASLTSSCSSFCLIQTPRFEFLACSASMYRHYSVHCSLLRGRDQTHNWHSQFSLVDRICSSRDSCCRKYLSCQLHLGFNAEIVKVVLEISWLGS